MFRTTSPSALFAAVPVVAVAALLLAGCSSGGSSSAAGASSSSSKAGASGPARHLRTAGAFGLAGPIASLGTGSFTLTAGSGPATVDYTAATTFTRTAAGTLADVRTGVCVAVTEAAGSDASTGSVDASVVRIAPSVKGSCALVARTGAPGRGGFGGGFGGGGFAGQRPSGAGGGAARRALLAGTVTATNGTGFVVTVDATNAAAGSAAGTTMAVAVSSATTYSVTTTVSSAALKIGECARVFSGLHAGQARGSAAASAGAPTPASPTGPVTAVSVTLSPPVNGGCPDLVRRPGGPGAGAGAGGSAGATGGA